MKKLKMELNLKQSQYKIRNALLAVIAQMKPYLSVEILKYLM